MYKNFIQFGNFKIRTSLLLSILLHFFIFIALLIQIPKLKKYPNYDQAITVSLIKNEVKKSDTQIKSVKKPKIEKKVDKPVSKPSLKKEQEKKEKIIKEEKKVEQKKPDIKPKQAVKKEEKKTEKKVLIKKKEVKKKVDKPVSKPKSKSKAAKPKLEAKKQNVKKDEKNTPKQNKQPTKKENNNAFDSILKTLETDQKTNQDTTESKTTDEPAGEISNREIDIIRNQVGQNWNKAAYIHTNNYMECEIYVKTDINCNIIDVKHKGSTRFKGMLYDAFVKSVEKALWDTEKFIDIPQKSCLAMSNDYLEITFTHPE